jgi:hypothetical protein
MIVSGSASPWPAYTVLVVVGLLLISLPSAGWLGHTVFGIRPIPSTVFLVGFTLLWYFAVSPLWGIVRLRAARRSFSGPAFIRIVRLDVSALEWLAVMRRKTKAPSAATSGTVLVATADDLQFWVGPNSELVPAAVVVWRDISNVSEAPGRSRIAVRFADGRTTVEVRVQVAKIFRPAIATGRARGPIVTELERLRTASRSR